MDEAGKDSKGPLVTLCMIVKDEESMLASCLSSVAGAVDEIVVVDTGSTDGTVAIAERYGACVIRQAWQNDFAAARNAGVEAARGKWILFLDADEALESSHIAQLREWAMEDGVEGFFLRIRNYVGEGDQGATVNPILRLFRNRPEHRFRGRIHEQIAASIVERNPTAAFRLTDIVVHHYGYRKVHVDAKNKVRRNMELLEEALRSEPDNAFYRYNIGVEYLRTGRPAEALVQFTEAAGRIDPVATSYAHLLRKYEIRCLQALGRLEEALERAEEAKALYPGYTDMLHCKAASEKALGRLGEAAATLLEAMKAGESSPIYHTEDGIGTYVTAYVLGEVQEERGQYDDALSWYTEALSYRASLTPPLYRSFQLLRVVGREKEIVPLLKSAYRIKEPEAWAKIAAILLQSRCGRAAADLLREKPTRRLPSSFRSLAGAEAELQRGRLSEARVLLQARPGSRKNPIAGAQALPLEAFAEQLRWLAGEQKGRWSDPLATLLAGMDRDGLLSEQRDGGPESLGKPPTEWAQWMRLLEGSFACARPDAGLRVLRAWRSVLRSEAGEPGADATGTDALVQSLSALADRHLEKASEAASGREIRPALIAARLTLPREDGL
ncbi:glycosyltransferase [Cohnella soli]|uniref:Glycosyltransferase n=1 Tax=Cohnella soli TaxID=425005 RepID=A0ABW0HSY8_9BACL